MNLMLKEKQEYYPKIINTILILFTFLLISFILDISYLRISNNSNNVSLSNSVIQSFSLIIIILWLKIQYKISFKDSLTIKYVTLKTTCILLLTILALGINIDLLCYILTLIIPITYFWVELFNAVFNPQNKNILFFLSIVIIGPIIEELLFR